jgi:hypothetical protein
MSGCGKSRAGPRPGGIPHQEIFIQTILIPKSHDGMMTRPQVHIPPSILDQVEPTSIPYRNFYLDTQGAISYT